MSSLVGSTKVVVGSGTLAIKLWDGGDGVCVSAFRPLTDGSANPLQAGGICVGDVLTFVNGTDVSTFDKRQVIEVLSRAALSGM
jgi:hypothetical protein